MKVKMILPALTEAKSPFWRPIKYSLFPPLGLATLASFLWSSDEIVLVDEHVEELNYDDKPDLVVIQVYITNAFRAYKIADFYRSKGCYVILGGLHVTSLPNEASPHADSIFLGPAEQSFPEFLKDFRNKKPKKIYFSKERTIQGLLPIRRDLIKRHKYFVPNSISVTRGCPHSCDFCYKDAFFKGGKSFYTQRVDEALNEIEKLPGKHLYFLDDHLFANKRFASELFEGMNGMNRVFQGAATVETVINGDLLEKATKAGLRSLFVGFETLNNGNLKQSNKFHNIGKDYDLAIKRLHDNGVMINASFVFGLDSDNQDVFKRTVDWAVSKGITTATFHIATPYPETKFYEQMEKAGRILTKNWDLYDTRHVVFKTKNISPKDLKLGYDYAYKEFYKYKSIYKAAMQHKTLKHKIKHLSYTAGWKKFEPLWNFIIKTEGLKYARPFLEAVLSKIK